MRTILPLAAFVALAPSLAGCNDHYGLLQAKQIENRAELVGGPVAMADVGDFLLQNDQIKVNILGPKDSPGPGIFGGSIVDIDLRRDRLGFENAQGRDRFAELFPVTNLLVPFPKDPADVKVLKTGEDGKEAVIRVEGKGAFLFEALAILRDQKPLLSALFPDIKTAFRFRTDYILRPGERFITIRTAVMLDDPQDDGCPDLAACPAQCETGFALDPVTQCLSCTCNDLVPLSPYTESTSVFGQIFGDHQNFADRKIRAGVVAGDFVFFGNQNNLFGPGIGFDTDKAVHDAFYEGRNTFQSPLSFDFVSAAGGDISYAYFTKPAKAGDPPSVVNVPIFTSAATAFLSAGKSCLYDESDDADCDVKRAWIYERYLSVGEGDVASASDEVFRARGTKTGEVRGMVRWLTTGEPAPKSEIFVFRDPSPGHAWRDIDELVEANQRRTGTYGIVNQISTDLGIDSVLDGDYHATLPPGDYVLVARTADGMGYSKPDSLHLEEGKVETIIPAVITPGTVAYRISDETGQLLPAKAVLVSLDAAGKPLEGDGKRRVYLGDGRLGNGLRTVEYPVNGTGTMRVEPGKYLFRASRGPEYGVFEQEVTVDPGGIARVEATVAREVDTTGFLSTDIHIHSTPSFDSGMPLPRRLSTVVAEHVEFAVPTDHDVETDYGPTIREMQLSPFVNTAVGVETTTIEQGHFIAFPLKYDFGIHPTHGSHDPTCESGGEIVAALKKSGADPDYDPFTILAHPRDGFFGYLYQLGVDPFTMKRQTGTLEAKNPVFQTASCDYDGMELINGKRFDLVRTPTVKEIIDWNRCLDRITAAKSQAELDGICPEIIPGLAAPCDSGERLAVCKDRNRTALVWASMKQILTRTPEEQEILINFTTPMVAAQDNCALDKYGDDPVPTADADQPCTHYIGHVDDYFFLLEHGMVKTQIASSDSHQDVHEPGYPRTYFKSPTDIPGNVKTKDVVDSLKSHAALDTYGPYVTASVKGKTYGETVKVAPGKVDLDLKVQTASWFGVDRIEVYLNGHMAQVISPTSKPQDIVDFDGKVPLDVPAGRDSWVVVVAMGLEDRNLMRKGTLDIPFGEIQISKVTADAFSLIPAVSSVFKPVPTMPDWFPIPAYAVTNAIFLDTGNDGNYNAPLPFPEWCSKPCDPVGEDVCGQQICLAEPLQCGVVVAAKCEHRIPWAGGDIH